MCRLINIQNTHLTVAFGSYKKYILLKNLIMPYHFLTTFVFKTQEIKSNKKY